MGEAIESLKGDVALCKAALAAGALVREGPRIKVPEPVKYNGQRDAKEIDNFLWSIEKYFGALHIEDDSSKINMATMYLGEDAILWWRRREADSKNGTFSIRTWDAFKTDFKRQFYPENAEEVAMKKLRGLKHTGSIKDYIRQYSSLMLEIPDMPEKSRLLYFMDGLQKWAEQELKRRNVQDLAQAIAAAESLIEFQRDRDSRRDKGKKVEDDQDGEESHQHKARLDQARGRDHSSSRSRERGKPLECFLCNGPHLARNCPQRQKLSAIVAQWGEEFETDAKCGAMCLEEGAKLANIRLLSTSNVEESKGEASTTQGTNIKHGGSLMIIDGKVNEGDTRILVDTGATHNFLALREAKDLGIKFTKVHGEMKAMNSRATPVYGKAWNVPVHVGKWKGKVDFLVVDMDDESVVLGMEFLSKVMPFKMGDGVLTITSKGQDYDIRLASKDVGKAKISSLRAKWKSRQYGMARGWTKAMGHRAKHQAKVLQGTICNEAREVPKENQQGTWARGRGTRDAQERQRVGST